MPFNQMLEFLLNRPTTSSSSTEWGLILESLGSLFKTGPC